MDRDLAALTRIAKESGVAIVASGGFYMQRNYPPEIATKLSAGIAHAVREPDFQKRLTHQQADPVGNTPAQMAEVVNQELERWGRVIREGKITVQ